MKGSNEEVALKLKLTRDVILETAAKGVRLRGTDWFAWITAGGSNTVLIAAETGIAEVLITAQNAWILTDEIEATRLVDEELPEGFQLYINPWADLEARQAFVREATEGGMVVSDRPIDQEQQLPQSLLNHKRILMPSEIERYRQVGRQASEAMTEVLTKAQPDWTEYQLAGAGAQALWTRGLHPTLTLVAGERRLPLYRHATATGEKLGREAMLVFCARGYGLYANLTRFVAFGSLPTAKLDLHRQIREIEAQALNANKAGMPLHSVYDTLDQAYQSYNFPRAIYEHHQGGTTGYLSREIVANPQTNDVLKENMAVAWNPSLRGAKIEDTFVIGKEGKLENLTFDSNWPSTEVENRLRPLPLEL